MKPVVYFGLLATLLVPIKAEVGVRVKDTNGDILPVNPYVQYIVDDPEPMTRWSVVSHDRPGRKLLNVRGDEFGDGPPNVLVHPTSRLIFVVWSKATEQGYDIVLSRFSAGAWQPVEYVTAEAGDEIDPSVVISSDGKVHVAYGKPGEDGDSPKILYKKSNASLSSWSPAERVSISTEAASRPSIAEHNGILKIAYEAWPAGTVVPVQKDIVISSKESNLSWVPEWVASTAHSGDLWIGLHSKDQKLWLEWIDHSSAVNQGEMGWQYQYSDGTWSPIQLDPFQSEEVYEFHVRERIRMKAMNGPIHPDGTDPPDLD